MWIRMGGLSYCQITPSGYLTVGKLLCKYISKHLASCLMCVSVIKRLF